MKRKKILFFSHAVTLAHFVRPLKWIECLDLDQHDVYLASRSEFKSLIPKVGVIFIEINCIDALEFSEIVRDAKPIYSAKVFAKHIEEDMAVMSSVEPDLVIGDFRHSLTVSCRLKKIKYINITNAYWSPHVTLKKFMPEAPIVRILGEKLFNATLAPFVPLILKINFFLMAFTLRKSFQMVGLNCYDYRNIIVDGDLTLFCDSHELVPLKKLQPNETFLGPLIWSSPAELPPWWKQLNSKKKRILLSLGSSGDISLLPLMIEWLSRLDFEVVVTLSGKKWPTCKHSNIFLVDFLPIESILSSFDLIICNGGSPMCHSGLNSGVPVIGIIFNNDQLLNMLHVQNRGAGLILRYWNITEEKLTGAIQKILTDSRFQSASKLIKNEFSNYDVPSKLRSIIKENL